MDPGPRSTYSAVKTVTRKRDRVRGIFFSGMPDRPNFLSLSLL